MQALLETTGGLFPAHTYLIDGTTLVAYIRVGQTEPYYFKSGIKGFSRSGRKFSVVEPNPFSAPMPLVPWIRKVAGSKPNVVYTVNTEESTCTCPGFTFRGDCRHVKELA
jgi:hypothetical protein